MANSNGGTALGLCSSKALAAYIFQLVNYRTSVVCIKRVHSASEWDRWCDASAREAVTALLTSGSEGAGPPPCIFNAAQRFLARQSIFLMLSHAQHQSSVLVAGYFFFTLSLHALTLHRCTKVGREHSQLRSRILPTW
jgi:hypothetical protein